MKYINVPGIIPGYTKSGPPPDSILINNYGTIDSDYDDYPKPDSESERDSGINDILYLPLELSDFHTKG